MRGLKFYYTIFTIFTIFFFPRQLTRLICFGRDGDELYIKKKRTYYLIYTGWFLFFYILCLMMGSDVGVDHKFSSFLHFCDLYSGKYDYVLCGEMEDLEREYRNEYKIEHISEYRVRRFEDVESVVKKMIEENSFVYDRYHFSDVRVEYESRNNYLIYDKEEVYATVETENRGPVKKVLIRWEEEKLKKRIVR